MSIVIVPPTPITEFPKGIPDVASPQFRGDALEWVRHFTSKTVGEVNTIARQINDIGKAVQALADQAQQQRALAEQAAAAAARHAAAAGMSSNAQSWVAGATYALNAVVWGHANKGTLYRCIVAHSGSNTPPEQDGVNWAAVGGRAVASPTAGPTQITLQRANGALTGVTFQQDGKAGSITLTRDATGRLQSSAIVFDGRKRTQTLAFDAAGRLVSVSAVEEVA